MGYILKKFIGRKTREQFLKVFAFIGVFASVAAAVYVLRRFFAPDYYEGYDDAEYEDEEEADEITEAVD